MRRNLKSPAQLANDGPLSLDQVRWLIHRSEHNGLSAAVCRIGRRVFIDVDAFDDWLMANNPGLRRPQSDQAGAA